MAGAGAEAREDLRERLVVVLGEGVGRGGEREALLAELDEAGAESARREHDVDEAGADGAPGHPVVLGVSGVLGGGEAAGLLQRLQPERAVAAGAR